MSIIRVRKDDRYFSASNEPFNDARLRWETRGLLAYLFSKPNNWQVRLNDLENQGPAGNHKIKQMLRDAQKHGYINRIRIARKDGTFYWITEVYESPSLNPNPQSSGGFSTSGSSTSGKLPDVLSTEKVSTELKEAASPLSQKDLEEIKKEADKTVNGLLEQERAFQEKQSKGEAWRGRELIPPNYLPYGDWWHSKTNQHMYGEKAKQKINTEWLKAFKEWWENNLTVEVLGQVYEAEKSWKGVIGKPSELTIKAIALQALPVIKDDPVDNSPEAYNKRVLEKIMRDQGVIHA